MDGICKRAVKFVFHFGFSRAASREGGAHIDINLTYLCINTGDLAEHSADLASGRLLYLPKLKTQRIVSSSGHHSETTTGKLAAYVLVDLGLVSASAGREADAYSD